MRCPDSSEMNFDREQGGSTNGLSSDTIGRKPGRSSFITSTVFRKKRLNSSLDSTHSTLNYMPVNEQRSCRKKIVIDPFHWPWSRIFKICCYSAFFLDPLFFYIPVIDNNRKCLDLDEKLKITICVLRSVVDIVYTFYVVLHYRIIRHHRLSNFIIYIFPGLPLPQVVILIIAPRVNAASPITRNLLVIVIISQYLSRLLKCFRFKAQQRFYSRMLPIFPTAVARSTLIICMLASHVIGAFWYLFTIDRIDACWRISCAEHHCNSDALYCGVPHKEYYEFLNSSCPLLERNEIKMPTDFDFGIFLEGLQCEVVVKGNFSTKLFYCLWWGWRNLSSLGQNLQTSKDIGENVSALLISITGVALFAVLISRAQKIVQSGCKRLEEMRVRRQEIEQWMSYEKLPADLRCRIRRYEQYRWQRTDGIKEHALIEDLPKDLKMDIHNHKCRALLANVPLFAKMDDQLMHLVYGRLKQVLYTENSYICRKGHTVDEMLFLKHGKLLSMTVDTSEDSGFSVNLSPGDFCGEELMTWALDPNPSTRLPTSTKTIKAIDDVEAFALRADDLRFVASQFRCLNHEQVIQQIFRYYSEQWRTWAAQCIQSAWCRYCRKKLEKSLQEEEDRLWAALHQQAGAGGGSASSTLAATIYASKFAVSILRELRRNRPPLVVHQKPQEPDFAAESSW